MKLLLQRSKKTETRIPKKLRMKGNNGNKKSLLKKSSLPMLKTYTSNAPKAVELKNSPSNEMLNSIINYSKSVRCKKIKNQKVLIHLN
jgi:hypothetical protein